MFWFYKPYQKISERKMKTVQKYDAYRVRILDSHPWRKIWLAATPLSWKGLQFHEDVESAEADERECYGKLFQSMKAARRGLCVSHLWGNHRESLTQISLTSLDMRTAMCGSRVCPAPLDWLEVGWPLREPQPALILEIFSPFFLSFLLSHRH